MQKHSISIETTQNVTIEYEVASIGDRILAYTIDATIVWIYLIGTFILLNNLKIEMSYTITILVLIPFFFYDLVSEIVLNGQTVGKIQRNIKVIRTDGKQPAVSHYLIRWFVKPIDTFFGGGLGIVAMLLAPYGQRLGDLAAGTCVVSTEIPKFLKHIRMPQIAENYQVMFPQVEQLSDRDIEIIRESMTTFQITDNGKILQSVSAQIKKTLQIESSMPNILFLRTILSDYFFLTSGIQV